MIPHEVMEQILSTARKSGVQSAAAGFTSLRERMVRFSNNSITVTNSWRTGAPTVYLVSNKRRAACMIEDENPSELNDVIEQLAKTMKVTPEGDVDFDLPPGPFKYQAILGIYDKRISEAESELIEAVGTGIDAAKKEGAVRVSGVVITHDWERHVMTSAGADGSDRGTEVEMTIRAFADDEATGQGISLSTTWAGFNPGEAGASAGRIAKMALNPAPGDAGKYNVVFAPSIYANLLNRVGDSASAYSVDMGLSFLGDSLGKKVASENFTLHDGSQTPEGPGSIAVDDEGYPTQNVTLISGGLLRNYLHNSYTAAKYKAQLTGSARFDAGIAGMVPDARSLILDPGEGAVEDLFDRAHDGLYVTNNWYTRFQNYRTGDFSTICRDGVFRIRNGKLAEAVRGLRISDNMIRILQSSKAMSKGRSWVKWWEVQTPTLTPHVLVSEVGMTTANK
jgi:PmbA protein